MPAHSSPSLRAALLAAGLSILPALGHAQTPAPETTSAAPTAESQPLDGRRNQKIEHITVEDRGAKVDEVRYGGVTQSITVQPKDSALPSYDIQPGDGTRQRSGATDGTSSNAGKRVWNVMKF
ncbi:hypothetical protein [Pseudacidovorax sp. RU35E]|uniref:hypothetical protein n=1 Tax=Pseudacidovorax sp. RU35E TaxID=1907403 RepID=UPI000954F74A|nr:hypothetical protein [Pseudacidovorax sp. RU35E]SIP92891.1 hypothetical protein SAMN05880557_101168 [Pseudacidovorax sp. RU35E]